MRKKPQRYSQKDCFQMPDLHNDCMAWKMTIPVLGARYATKISNSTMGESALIELKKVTTFFWEAIDL